MLVFYGYVWRSQAEVHTNRERAAALLRAERRVQEREKWLEGEQQELDQTRDRVGLVSLLVTYLGYCHCHLSRSLLSLPRDKAWVFPVI